jgi:hypothetical protein
VRRRRRAERQCLKSNAHTEFWKTLRRVSPPAKDASRQRHLPRELLSNTLLIQAIRADIADLLAEIARLWFLPVSG